MPRVRRRFSDETDCLRSPHRGLAPKDAGPWASRKNRRRRESEFSLDAPATQVNFVGRPVDSCYANVSTCGQLCGCRPSIVVSFGSPDETIYVVGDEYRYWTRVP